MSSSFITPVGHHRYELTTILEMENSVVTTTSTQVIGYARVSGQKQRKELQAQIKCIQQYAQYRDFELHKIYFDIASGINDSRRNFIKMLKSIPIIRPKAVIVTYGNRLSRFGCNIIRLFCDIVY